MARPKSLDKRQDVCPFCNTRLRIQLQGSDRVECPCPECKAPLTAHLGMSGAVEVSKAKPTAAKAESREIAPDWSASFLSGRTRTVAAAVTGFFGILIVAAVTHSSNEPETGSESNFATAIDPASQVPPQQQSPADSQEKTEGSVLASKTSSAPAAALPEETPAETETAESPEVSEALALPAKVLGDPSVLLVVGTEPPAQSFTQKILNPGISTVPTDGEPVADPTTVSKPVSRPMSLRQRLGISIRSFRQEKPISLRELVQTIENMCQIRVDVSTVSAAHLDKQITVSRDRTTPADILTEAGRKCGLRIIVAENSIRLTSETE